MGVRSPLNGPVAWVTPQHHPGPLHLFISRPDLIFPASLLPLTPGTIDCLRVACLFRSLSLSLLLPLLLRHSFERISAYFGRERD